MQSHACISYEAILKNQISFKILAPIYWDLCAQRRCTCYDYHTIRLADKVCILYVRNETGTGRLCWRYKICISDWWTGAHQWTVTWNRRHQVGRVRFENAYDNLEMVYQQEWRAEPGRSIEDAVFGHCDAIMAFKFMVQCWCFSHHALHAFIQIPCADVLLGIGNVTRVASQVLWIWIFHGFVPHQ